MNNTRYPKNLITVRIVATIIILLSLVLPYFGVSSHSKAPLVILITLFTFNILENKYNEKIANKKTY